MKTNVAIISLILSLLGGASSTAKPKPPSIQVAPTPDSTENAGNQITVEFTAAGIPDGESAEIWFVDAATDNTIAEIVAIDIPVKKGANLASFNIPFSWNLPGKYHVKIVVTILDKHGLIAKQVVGIGTGTIRIRSAIIWPYGGAILNKGHGSWVTWSTESPINAEFFDAYLYNESTGYLESLAKGIDPSVGRYLWTVPNVSGRGFRILLIGYVFIPGIGDDPAESTQSEKLNIQ